MIFYVLENGRKMNHIIICNEWNFEKSNREIELGEETHKRKRKRKRNFGEERDWESKKNFF